jgi:hypothetical protein
MWMNKRKFLFVTCVNNEQLYEACVNHIAHLNVPPNYVVELLPIRGAKSMTAGYNQALLNDAKYKIYLHQDVFIINKNFLWDILELFQTYPSLGLLGLAGCTRLPPSGIWWEGSGLVGKLIGRLNTTCLQIFGEVTGPFQAVEAVDGFLMATQYDIPWREDIIEGFHFYDISQSIEFRKRGYLVGVPKQSQPWCLHFHDPVDLNEVLYYQKIFLKHYQVW